VCTKNVTPQSSHILIYFMTGRFSSINLPKPCTPARRTSFYTTPNQNKIFYNCTSLLSSRTSSPGLKAGIPMYGQPSQRKASPRLQFPHEPTLPRTVKSTSARSSAPSLRVWSCASAFTRVTASSAAIFSARPHVQSLHARRRFPTRGAHSGAAKSLAGAFAKKII